MADIIKISEKTGVKSVGIIKNKEVFDVNPFINNLKIMTKTKSQVIGKGLTVQDMDGMELGMSTVAAYKKVDNQEFIKIFSSMCGIIFNLSNKGTKVLSLLIYGVTYDAIGKDYLQLSYNIAVEYMEKINKMGKFGKAIKISQSDFSKGIHELIENNLIAGNNRGDGWYWVNPSYIFNGDRVAFIQVYEKKKKEEKEKSQIQQGSFLEFQEKNHDPF